MTKNTATKNQRYWWHWVIIKNPDGTQEQSPVRDCIGEDCNLFDALNNIEHVDGMIKTYRHAIADQNVVTDDDGRPLYTMPLKVGQESGKYLTAEEYKKNGGKYHE